MCFRSSGTPYWTSDGLTNCRIFLITTCFSVILMTGRAKLTRDIPPFLNQGIKFNNICSEMHLKFVPSLKHEWGMRGNSLKITLPQKGSNTRYLEREELMQNTWVPSKGQTKITSVTDFIKFRFLLHMSRLIRIGTFHWPDFSGKFYYL